VVQVLPQHPVHHGEGSLVQVGFYGGGSEAAVAGHPLHPVRQGAGQARSLQQLPGGDLAKALATVTGPLHRGQVGGFLAGVAGAKQAIAQLTITKGGGNPLKAALVAVEFLPPEPAA
jgi:hypothetical protein